MSLKNIYNINYLNDIKDIYIELENLIQNIN